MPDETAPRCPILGRRELTPEEVALVNEIRAHSTATRALLARVRSHLGDSADRLPCGLAEAESFSWANTAEQQFNLGLMSLIRAVTRDSGSHEGGEGVTP